MTIKNLVGTVYGKLTITQELPRIGHNRKVLVMCACGTSKEVLLGSLRSGRTVSCGCVQKERTTTHGQSRSGNKLYRVWASMKARCTGEGHSNYAGRGIDVCPEWNVFEAFQKWAQMSGYAEGLSIDRRDNDKGYSPDNCRWTTPTTQSRNRRSVSGSSSQYIGVYWSTVQQKWVAQITVNKSKKTLGLYDTELDAAIAREKYIHSQGLTDFTLNNVL